MNTSKIYETDLQGLSIRIKGKSVCFIIDGKAHWSTLSDRISKKINELIVQQDTAEKVKEDDYRCFDDKPHPWDKKDDINWFYDAIFPNLGDGCPGPQDGPPIQHW